MSLVRNYQHCADPNFNKCKSPRAVDTIGFPYFEWEVCGFQCPLVQECGLYHNANHAY